MIKLTINQLLQELIAKTGENVKIARFARFEVGSKSRIYKMDIKIIENDIKSFQTPMETEMQKVIKHFESELLKIRTGRAHTSLVEDIQVVAIPAHAIKAVAVLSAPESRLITIQPWDPA